MQFDYNKREASAIKSENEYLQEVGTWQRVDPEGKRMNHGPSRLRFRCAASALLVIVGAKADGPATPFDYRVAIETATITPSYDARQLFYQCMAPWKDFGKTRQAVFEEIQQNGWLSQPGTMFLELGGTDRTYYGHALAVAGPRSAAIPARKDLISLDDEALSKALRGFDLEQLQGYAGTNVRDGECYFLTVVMKDRSLKQVAVFGYPSVGKPEAVGEIISVLLRHVAMGKRGNQSAK